MGTDCSGLDTPILALRKMGIPHVHRFSCDFDAKVRKHLEANVDEGVEVYDNVLGREVKEVPKGRPIYRRIPVPTIFRGQL